MRIYTSVWGLASQVILKTNFHLLFGLLIVLFKKPQAALKRNGVAAQRVCSSAVKKFTLFELISLRSHFEQSCGIPGWPEANSKTASWPQSASARG